MDTEAKEKILCHCRETNPIRPDLSLYPDTTNNLGFITIGQYGTLLLAREDMECLQNFGEEMGM
jgi:hypothetical protein